MTFLTADDNSRAKYDDESATPNWGGGCASIPSHGDASDKFCPYFADQLFGAYLGSVVGLAAEIVAAQSTYLMENKGLVRLMQRP